MGSALEEMREAHKARHERMWGTPQPVPMPAPRDPEPTPVTHQRRMERVKVRVDQPPSPAAPEHPSIKRIQEVVSAYFDIPRASLLAEGRGAVDIVLARHTAMLLCRRLTPRSLPEIGRMFCRCNHTTVMNAVMRMEAKMESDSEFAETIEALSEKIKIDMNGEAAPMPPIIRPFVRRRKSPESIRVYNREYARRKRADPQYRARETAMRHEREAKKRRERALKRD